MEQDLYKYYFHKLVRKNHCVGFELNCGIPFWCFLIQIKEKDKEMESDFKEEKKNTKMENDLPSSGDRYLKTLF